MFYKIKNFLWKNKLRKFFTLLIFLIFLISLFYFFKTPSNNRDWSLGQERIPEIIFEKNNFVKIKNFRNFDWKNKKYLYQDFEFNLEDLISVEIVQARFLKVDFIAHDFVIFKSKDGRKFALSIESRREKGEKFTLIGGVVPSYELIYIWGSDKDILEIRKIKKQRLEFYNLTMTKEELKNFFKKLSYDTNALIKKPEFYNLFVRNCTNLLVEEMPEKYQKKVSFLTNHFAPGWLIDDLRN